jgi:hypothetical protein
MKVVFSHEAIVIPKFELSSNVECNDSFREDYNKWLLDFFGTKTVSRNTGEPVITYRDLVDEVEQNGSKEASILFKMCGLFGTAGLFL